MPKNKDAYSRYRIIDSALRKMGYVKTKELADLCSEKLGIPISSRTIQKDIDDLKFDTSLNLNVPIKYCNSRKAHYYPDNVESIFPAIELQEEELNALIFYAKSLTRNKHHKIFKDITVAIEKVLDAAIISPETKELFQNNSIIQTEEIPNIKGSDLIQVIIRAIKNNKKITFNYQKFGDSEVKNRKMTPILLKEDKHLWYIIGQLEDKPQPTTFALDRMSELKIIDEKYSPIPFDAETYFKHSFGITVYDAEPEEIILSFVPSQGNYIKTLKIHNTQREVLDDDNEYRISIKVIPTYEFYEKLLSYGDFVKVISPDFVVKKHKDRLERALKKYL